MKNRHIAIVLIILLLGASLICACFFLLNKMQNNDESDELYRLSSVFGYKGDIFHFVDFLNGKELEIKNSKVFIDRINTEVESEDKSEKTIIKRVGFGKGKIELVCQNGKKYKLCPIGKKEEESLKKAQIKQKTKSKNDNKGSITPQIVVDNVNTTHQKNIKVTVRIKNNPGILGAKLNVDFNNSDLDLVKVENGRAFKDVLTLTKPKVFNSGCCLLWDGVSIKNKDVKDGELVNLFFNAKKTGKSRVTLSYKDGDIVDNNLDNVFVSVISGNIFIKNK